MNTVCHPSAPAGLRPVTGSTWLADLQRIWAGWREQARQQAEWRALEQLSESTRRDIGLADRTPIVSDPVSWQQGRGLW